MGTTSPLNADDDLFAAKGEAAPLEKTRPPTAGAGTPRNISPVTTGNESALLPGIVSETSDKTGSETPENGEPAPAASLLTIVDQESAARSRIAARVISSPEPDEHISSSDTGPDPDLGIADQSHDQSDTDSPVYLPVPVRINLPSVVASPDQTKPNRYRILALLAASVVVAVAGAIALYIPGTPTPSQSANTGLPNAATTVAGPVPALAAEAGTQAIPDAVRVRPKAEIDAVRFDSGGRAVVTGRALPETEFIVLRNRRPLGTARSGADGRWTFTARVPSRTEQHEISVVPMQVDTSFTVDQPSFVPRPRRRPALPSPNPVSYFVQIASLPSAADAGREAAKLTSKLANTIAAHRISVRTATIEQGRKVYRVAIEGFATKQSADTACIRIRTRKTPCLVMRTP